MMKLWRFVRERALALAINGQWLGLQVRDGRLTSPVLDKDSVNRFVDAFWSGSGITRSQNSLLPIGRAILQQTGPAALLGLQEHIPSDSPIIGRLRFATERDRPSMPTSRDGATPF